MVEIQIQDKKYEIPTEWKDITLEWWYGLYSIIQKHKKFIENGGRFIIILPKIKEINIKNINKYLKT